MVVIAGVFTIGLKVRGEMFELVLGVQCVYVNAGRGVKPSFTFLPSVIAL